MIESFDTRDVTIDLELQTRQGGLDSNLVQTYIDAISNGEEFPPIVVFRLEDGTLLLADGFHRIRATEAHSLDISAEVHEGTRQDALDYALFEANRKHGKRLSNSDIERIVETAVRDPRFKNMSSRQLAKKIHVGHATVSRTRKKLGITMGAIIGEDGKVYSRFKDEDEFYLRHRSSNEKLIRSLNGLVRDLTDMKDKMDDGQKLRVKCQIEKLLEGWEQ